MAKTEDRVLHYKERRKQPKEVIERRTVCRNLAHAEQFARIMSSYGGELVDYTDFVYEGTKIKLTK